MRWYMSRNGQTWGPVEEAEVIRSITDGMTDAYVRDEAGSAWMQVAQSPFASFANRGPAEAPAPVPSRASPPRVPPGGRSPANALAHSLGQVVGQGLRRTGRWLLLVFLVLLLLTFSATGAFGIVVGAGLIGWGVLGHKRLRRTAVELVVGRPSPARWAAILTGVVGATSVLVGIAGLVGQHSKKQAQEAAVDEANKQAVEAAARRKGLQAALLAEAPRRATEWRTSLKTVAAGLAAVRAAEDVGTKLGELTTLRDKAKAWLGQIDSPKPADVVEAVAEIEATLAQVQKMKEFIDAVVAFEASLRSGRDFAARRSWLYADHEWDVALGKVEALQVADPSLRKLIVGGFDPDRKKAEVVALKGGIASAVAGARRQAAAQEAAAKKREQAEEKARAAQQAYQQLCGEAPVASAWDGEVIGLARTIKETANDPDSIEVTNCTQPQMTTDNCWLTTCNVRGKNGFGGLVLQRQTWSYSKVLGFRRASN